MSGYRWRKLGSYGSQLGMPPAVFLLLMANLAIFLLQFLTITLNRSDPIGAYFSFIPYWAFHKLQLWRFVSYMFLHGDLTHLLFNMIGLWLFGTRMELYWGTRTFTWYYFVCGVGGAVLHGLFSLSGLALYGPMVGASGALFGLLLAFGLAFPRAVIFVFMIIPMPAFIAVIIFALLAIMGFGGPHVAHLAHLGGMASGFLFLWLFTGGRFAQIPRLPRRAAHRGGRDTPWGAARTDGRRGSFLARLNRQFTRWRTRLRLTLVDAERRADGSAGENGTTRGKGNGSGRPRDLDRVDEILEKISRQGLKSLTAEEQDILRRASKRD